jgi:hypothetical protein
MTWLNAFGTFIVASENCGCANTVVAALCSMALWVLFGPTK